MSEIGNKSDDTNNVKVTTREGQSRCTKLKLDFYIETSAKEGTNVAELFQKVALRINNTEFETEQGPFNRKDTLGRRKLKFFSMCC